MIDRNTKQIGGQDANECGTKRKVIGKESALGLAGCLGSRIRMQARRTYPGMR